MGECNYSIRSSYWSNAKATKKQENCGKSAPLQRKAKAEEKLVLGWGEIAKETRSHETPISKQSILKVILVITVE